MKNNHEEQQSFKKQRDAFTQYIRKQKRQEKFSKKRNYNQHSNQQSNNGLLIIQDTQESAIKIKTKKKLLIVDNERKELIQNLISNTYSLSDFPKLVNLLYSKDISDKHHGIIGIRKIMSFNNSPNINLLVDNNLVPYLMEYIYQNKYPQLQLEAAWILTNVASGPTQYCRVLVQNNGIPAFVKLIMQNKPGVVDQAIWAVGNIAGDCSQYRDQLIKQGVMEYLIKVINQTKSKDNVIQGTWALSNLCRGNPLPKYENIKEAVIPLCKVMKTKILDVDGLADCLWAISYLTQGPKVRLSPLMDEGVISALIQFAKGKILMIVIPALRILGNISVGNQKQTDQLIKNGILELIQELFNNSKLNIRRQVCWILSNIAAGTKPQVDQILNRKSLIQKTLNLFEVDSQDVKRQICYVFSNMVHMGDIQKVLNLINTYGVLNLYADIIINENKNDKLLITCLQTLSMLLKLGDKIKQISRNKNILVNQLVRIPSLVQTFQSLQYHQSTQVYNALHNLLVKHFDVQNKQENNKNNTQFENLNPNKVEQMNIQN